MTILAAFLAVACAAMAACSGSDGGETARRPAGAKGVIVVGVSGAFAENQIVAEMYAQVLEQAGYTRRATVGPAVREISQNALESGQIDLKPEYLSSLLLFLDPNAQASSDPADVAGKDSRLLQPKRDHACSRRRRPRTPTSSWRTRRRPSGST